MDCQDLVDDRELQENKISELMEALNKEKANNRSLRTQVRDL